MHIARWHWNDIVTITWSGSGSGGSSSSSSSRISGKTVEVIAVKITGDVLRAKEIIEKQ